MNDSFNKIETDLANHYNKLVKRFGSNVKVLNNHLQNQEKKIRNFIKVY